MKELLEKRTYKQKIFDNEDGTFTLKAHVGDIHYKDDNGIFQDSDFTPVDQGAYYEMNRHNYHLQVAKDFAAPLLMRYTNRYEGANHTITYEPFALAWYNPQTDDVQIFRNQQSVQAEYKPETNSFYYQNAFGNGIDFEITIMRSGFKKEVVIPNKPNVFPTAPSQNHRMVALFKYGGTTLRILKEKSREEWDKSSFMETIDEAYEFQEENNADAKSFIRPAYGEDSSVDKKRISLRVMWKLRAGQLWQIKEIPLDKMEQATFPVRFDTTTSYAVSSNDAALIDRSGAGAYTSSSVWDNVHDSSLAEADENGAIIADIGHGHNGKYYIYRGHFVFDTSGLPTGASISAAILKLYVKSLTDFGGGTYNKAYIGLSNGPDSSTLALADFDDLGDDGGGAGTAMNTPQIQLNDGEDIGGLTTSAVNDFAFNSGGLAYIDDAGLTKLSFRTGHDFTDTFPNSNVSNRLAVATSEDTVGDPELEITYTVSATSDIKSVAGVTQANIKSIVGVTNANLKSMAGVANS